MFLGLGLGFGSRNVSAPAPFSPASISNLHLWLDASDTSTITHVGGSVSQWNDKSGNGYHATQGTGARQPTTGAATINGLNALTTSAGNKLMLLPSGLYTIPNGNNTVFTVIKQNASSGDQWALSTGINPVFGFLFRVNGTNLRALNNSGFAGNTDQTITSNVPHITEVTRNGATLTQTVDGIAGTNGTAVSVTASNLFLFNFDSTVGSGLVGNEAEILFYNRALSNSEKNQIGSYLGTKWGVTWTNI